MIYHDSHEEFDPRDYHSGSTSGNYSVAGLRRDRVIDALRWPLIWLAIGGMFVGAAWGVGHIYGKLRCASATYRHDDRETSISINRVAAGGFAIEPVSTTDNPISGR